MRALTSLTCIALCACGRVGFDPTRVTGGDADAGAGDSDAPGSWGPPTLLGITWPEPVDDPTLTPDMLTLFCNTNGAADIATASRLTTASPWSALTIDAALSSSFGETEPDLSPDGLEMYFGSIRPGGSGNFDIWVASRASRVVPWGTPVPIPELDSPNEETAGSTSADGLEIVFDIRIGLNRNIAISNRTSRAMPWGPPTSVAAVNSASDDAGPFLTADRLGLYFSSQRRDGSDDLFVARRATLADPFGAPEAITELDTAANEADPWVSPDGHHLVFTSNRNGMEELWESTR